MATRFMRRGVSKYYFLETIAALTMIPTRVEITAGTDLSKDIAAVEGWSSEAESIETPDMGSRYTSTIPGGEKAADSSFTFYEQLSDDAIETLLPSNAEGFVVILRKGDVPASKSMDIFPVRVASRTPEHSSGNDPARFSVKFAVTSPPALDKAVPALT